MVVVLAIRESMVGNGSRGLGLVGEDVLGGVSMFLGLVVGGEAGIMW